MLTLYGIPNCETVKKARRWLDGRAIAYRFHDLRKEPPSAGLLAQWAAAVGWEVLLNRRGITWRQLPPAERAAVGEREALRLMQAHPTLVKRPVLTGKERIEVGFSESAYAALFGKA